MATQIAAAIRQAWLKVEALLRARGLLEVFDLNPSALPDAIIELERHVGASVPEDLKTLLLVHDGQGAQRTCGVFFGDEFLSVAQIRSHWDNWRSLEGDGLNEELAASMSSEPPGFVRLLYHSRAWIPFTHDGGGNHTGSISIQTPAGPSVR